MRRIWDHTKRWWICACRASCPRQRWGSTSPPTAPANPAGAEDATGFTRNAITAVLETALPKLAAALLQVYDWLSGRPIGEYHPSVSFGEYAAPDFATRVKAIREADAAGAMSVEAKVEELYGGSKKQDWIDAEIARLKAEQGIDDAGNPPSGEDDLP